MGSEGTSHITRAVVKETSGKDTLDGGPGTSSKVLTCIEGVLSFPEKDEYGIKNIDRLSRHFLDKKVHYAWKTME